LSAVIVSGERHDGSDPDHEQTVLDPASGELRWRFRAHGFELYRSGLVVADSNEKVIKQLDWHSGAEKWRVPVPGGEGWAMLSVQPAASMVGGRSGTVMLPADDRLLLVDAAGTLHVYDARTGAVLATRPNVGTPATGPDNVGHYQAYDGKL
jgi:outer membrane protein assembly factor BamB